MTNEEIKNLRKQGLTYEEIGKKYGLSRQRVEQICKKLYHNNYYCKKELKTIVRCEYGTVSEFCELINMSKYHMSKIMDCHSPIRYSSAKKIHNALKEYKFEDLFEEVEK